MAADVALAVPASHSWQLVAPSSATCVPGTHSAHGALLVVLLCLPGTHSSHPLSSAFGCFPGSQTVEKHESVQKLSLLLPSAPLPSAIVPPCASLMFQAVSPS